MKTAIDQTLHFLAALGILMLFSLGNIATGFAAGALIGLMRELGEAGTPLRWPNARQQLFETDAILDMIFWGWGGALAAWLVFYA